jgi:two-component system phosphate regulon sensor histidine kinase PhoR
LRLGRNIYAALRSIASLRSTSAIVITVVACSLFSVGIVLQLGSGFTAGWRGLYGLLCISIYFVGALGVICLFWYWLKLAKAVTSMVQSLRTEKPVVNDSNIDPLINELNEAVNSRIGRSSDFLEPLQKQVKDLQIQIQLSQRQKGNIEAIIYSLHDAVIVVDEFDKLLMANKAAGKLFSFDFTNSRFKPVESLIAPDKRAFADFLRQSKQSRAGAIRREIEFLQDEKSRIYDCVVSCVYDDKQQVCGIVAVLHDITKGKEIQRMKNDFVSHVSHELKTPLASIMAYSEMLDDGEADDEQTRKQMYSVIHNQSKRLSRLIDDILNISRIESGLIKIEKKPVSLTMVIEEQLQMITSYAEEKEIEVTTHTPIIHDVVYADKDMISQVIVNLLSNSVKYTPRGGKVRIDTMVDETASVAQVTVTDTGVGIPKDEIAHVFDKFYRVSANNSQAKGTGLGLNLVKQIIEKGHNGRVFVISEPGVGSTFGFELPLAVSSAVRAI